MCFQQKKKILYFFQRFKGEKKSNETGPAIWLLTPNGIFGLFQICLFEISKKCRLASVTTLLNIENFSCPQRPGRMANLVKMVKMVKMASLRTNHTFLSAVAVILRKDQI
jgi:hypothetical protein